MRPIETKRDSFCRILASSVAAALASAFFNVQAFASQQLPAVIDSKTDGVIAKPEAATPVQRLDAGWDSAHDELVKQTRAHHYDIVIFGDSIVSFMNLELLHSMIGPNAVNFGIGGDQTQNLLWRMQNGELDFPTSPRVFVLLIGTNNLRKPGVDPLISQNTSALAATNEGVCQGVQACVNELRSNFPYAKVLVLGILPRGQAPDTEFRQRIKDVNLRLKELADNKHVFFADIGQSFLEPDGKISPEVMADFTHPTKVEGYQRMFAALKPVLDQMQ